MPGRLAVQKASDKIHLNLACHDCEGVLESLCVHACMRVCVSCHSVCVCVCVCHGVPLLWWLWLLAKDIVLTWLILKQPMKTDHIN